MSSLAARDINFPRSKNETPFYLKRLKNVNSILKLLATKSLLLKLC